MIILDVPNMSPTLTDPRAPAPISSRGVFFLSSREALRGAVKPHRF